MKTGQKVDISHVTQTVAARVLGVTVKTLRNWECPRNSDSSYSIPDVVQWRLSEVAKERTPSDKAAIELQLKSTDLELRKLALAEKNGELWPSEWVRSVAHRQSVALREFWSHAWRRDAPAIMGALGVPTSRMGAFVDAMHDQIAKMMDEWISLGRDIQPPNGSEEMTK